MQGGSNLQGLQHFLGFVIAWGFDLLKFLKIFCEYVDVWA